MLSGVSLYTFQLPESERGALVAGQDGSKSYASKLNPRPHACGCAVQACHALLHVQRALAQWCAQQPRAALRAPPSGGSQPGAGASQDEVGLLGELQQLVAVVPQRCQAVAAEFAGAAPLRLRRFLHPGFHWTVPNTRIGSNS